MPALIHDDTYVMQKKIEIIKESNKTYMPALIHDEANVWSQKKKNRNDKEV